MIRVTYRDNLVAELFVCLLQMRNEYVQVFAV